MSKRRVPWIALVALVTATVVPCALARAAPPPSQEEAVLKDVEAAGKAFNEQQWQRVIDLLEPFAKEPKQLDEPTRVRVLEQLGISHYFTAGWVFANSVFEKLLKLRNAHRLSSALWSDKLIKFFEDVRQKLIDDGEIGTGTPTPPVIQTRIKVKKTTERLLPIGAYLLPGGAGQFANDDDVAGYLLLTGQALGAVGNVISYWVVDSYRDSRGGIPPDKISGAEVLQGLAIGSTILMAGCYLVSVIHGLVRRPEPVETEEYFEEPKEGEEPTVEPPKDSGGVTLRVGPAAGLGLGVSGTF